MNHPKKSSISQKIKGINSIMLENTILYLFWRPSVARMIEQKWFFFCFITEKRNPVVWMSRKKANDFESFIKWNLIENFIVFIAFFVQITVTMFASEETRAHVCTFQMNGPVACVAFDRIFRSQFAWKQRQTNYAEVNIFIGRWRFVFFRSLGWTFGWLRWLFWCC